MLSHLSFPWHAHGGGADGAAVQDVADLLNIQNSVGIFVRGGDLEISSFRTPAPAAVQKWHDWDVWLFSAEFTYKCHSCYTLKFTINDYD